MKKKLILAYFICLLLTSKNSLAQNKNQETFTFAYSFLGAYVKTLEYQDLIKKYCEKYNVDFDLIFALAMYESGGHNDLISWAGAKGLMQVMPKTQKLMKTENSIEAGIKYIAYLINLFPNRIDKVIVGYNGGPKAAQSQRLKMESLQYLQGVSLYLRLIKQYKKEIEQEIKDIKIYTVTKNDKNWMDISKKTNKPILELRLFNPFLIIHGFKTGSKIAYLEKNINFSDFTAQIDENKTMIEYEAKKGEIYQHLVNTFSAKIEDFRYDNGLWHNSQLFIGEKIQINIPIQQIATHVVKTNDTLESIALKYQITEWELILANGLFNQKLEVGQKLKIARLSNLIYEVKKGDTLYDIAQQFKVDLKLLAKYNNLKSPYILYPGQKLFIPQ